MASKTIQLTDLESLEGAAECLRTLAHPHRLRMLQMLGQNAYSVYYEITEPHLAGILRCIESRFGVEKVSG
jgi:hypothetical protein